MTVSYTTAQQAVEDASNIVLGYLKSGSYGVLYNLMSADFKSTFSKNDFENSFIGSTAVSSGQVSGAPKVYGANNEWAEQATTLFLTDGSSQKYLNVYHLENSAWTLFGTEEQ